MFALLLVVAVALAVFFSGRSYYFCVAFQKVVDKTCECEDCPVHGEHDDGGPRLGKECCEEHQIAELPRASTRFELPRVPPAPASLLPNDAEWTAFVPLRRLKFPPATPRIVARPALIRAGPSSSAERCIALQVFHC
ncbi:MAG: hypothetical protein IPM54_00045 [Polyangiaceae bacterium]|nr:hypothetical protein [Polyangiaceae bacterium]